MYSGYPNYSFNNTNSNYPSNPYLERLNNVQNSLSQPTQNTAPTNLIRVTGIEGAKAYQMSPNSTVALFDGNEDIMYIKMTDGANFPTIKTFRFQAVETVEPNNTEYVSKDEFNKFKLQNDDYL